MTSAACFAQWTYKSGGNDFDGKYKTCSVEGTGGKSPYTTPGFYINHFENQDDINMYFTGVGYLGCSSNRILLKFPNDSIIYKVLRPGTDEEKEALFINEIYNLEINEFLKKLMENNSVSVRVQSSCNKNDYKFSLKGSSKAITFVTKDLKDKYFLDN